MTFQNFPNQKCRRLVVRFVRSSLMMKLKNLLTENPDCVVIQLGTGLDARFDRLGRPNVTHWYDLDLPESIETRQKLLPASGQNSYLPMSLFDFSWIDMVASQGKPILIIVEGVLMYFSPDEVRGFLKKLLKKFQKRRFWMDLLPKKFL